MSKNKKKKASNRNATSAAQAEQKNAQVAAAPTKEKPAQTEAMPKNEKTAQATAASKKEKTSKKRRVAQATTSPKKEKAAETTHAAPEEVKAAKAVGTEDVKAQKATVPANSDKTKVNEAPAQKQDKEQTEGADKAQAGSRFPALLKKLKFKKQETPKLEKAEKSEKQETKAAAKTEKADKAEDKAPDELEKENQLHNLKKRLLDLNPVFVKIVAAVPLLGAAVSLKNGILLSLVMLLTVVFLNLLLIPIYRFIPKQYRPAVSFLAAGIVITPLYATANYFSPSIAASCGIYLPLLAISALALCEKRHFGKKYVVPKTALDAIFNGLGFVFAAIIFSVLREIIANGTLYDRPLPYISEAKFKFAANPAGAFILLAVLAALFRKIFNYKEGKGDDTL